MLFSTIGTFGRILCVLFFACLSIAGVTSLVANVEMVTHTLYDFGGNVTLSIDIKLKVNKFKTLIGINILCLCSLKCLFILMVKLLKLTEFCWVILLVPRKFGMPCTVLLLFLGGLASALNLDVLTNQVGLLYNDIGTLFQFNDLLNKLQENHLFFDDHKSIRTLVDLSKDFVWGFALVINGFMLQIMVVTYGSRKFREEMFNRYSLGDWRLPRVWEWLVK